MMYVCLRRFRVDVLNSIKSEISADRRDDALLDAQPFRLDYFEEIMASEGNLISGSRCDFKQASHLGHFLVLGYC